MNENQSNSIKLRQNEKYSITLLAAQRQLYSHASMYNIAIVCFTILIPLVFSFVQSIMPYSELIAAVITVMALVACHYLETAIINKKRLASKIQLLFDLHVFQLQWNELIFGEILDNEDCVAVYSEKIMANNNKRQSLYDWYNIRTDSCRAANTILGCQKESIRWDSRLRERYKRAIVILFVIILFILLLLGIIHNWNIRKWLIEIIVLIPLLQWMLSLQRQLSNDISLQNELRFLFNHCNPDSVVDLQIIEMKRTEVRERLVVIPDFFYKIFKAKDELIEKEISDLVIHK